MNYKFIATRFGEAVKYDTTVNEVNRTFNALTNIKRKNYPNDAITSVRSGLIYSWVMTIGESNIDEQEKNELVRQAINTIVINDKVKEKLLGLIGTAGSLPKARSSNYVNQSRIAEIKTLKGKNFDLSRLIKLCEELNIAFENNCHFSVAMLVRSILDHVPPIFGCNSFAEVANNCKGTRSFKSQMQHLEVSSRKIADSYLHTQIRNKESLPNSTQVDFSNDLDVLLGEIHRLLK